MKRSFNYEDSFNAKKQNRSLHSEQKAGGFRCSHCKWWVPINPFMGTANRNHCNVCLWSRHVDVKKGDRMASCQGGMQPIGLTFKHDGFGRVGELMLIHLCCGCQKISINRIAGDDDEQKLLAIFTESQHMQPQLLARLEADDILLLGPTDLPEIRRQLFGR